MLIERRHGRLIDRLKHNAFAFEPNAEMRNRAKMESHYLAVISSLNKLLPVDSEKLNERCRLDS